ncbi:hypothetical protein ACFFSW_12170 [Saccharothrix longispora]|uniref:SH3 domain-containing protein n=1 Tax=Saccharothrix longispora TaxID=33920 RepID=A0ABU1Q4T7_9PSEU|nr:hypothetical protein [Saccharothrix longispora]MDR6597908.1 hypothetical protein [Saccharothrix longispora]
MKTLSRALATAVPVLGLVLAAGTAHAAPVTTGGEAGVACTQVWQYRVTADGDMTDAPSGGSYIGNAFIDDTFNVRVHGSPRHYGANVNNGKWGWIMAGKLQYTGNTWCA